jgi:hypothetical protein
MNRRVAILIARLLGPRFFDRSYLQGRYFTEADPGGWMWVLKGIWFQKVLGFNRRAPWPMSPRSTVSHYENLVFHPDDLNNLQSPGCYFQNFAAAITIGRGSYIGPNVGIITANHDPEDLDRHLPGAPVTIGARCWIGMNAVVMPGVVLGDRTIVGAGSVVTKSFPEGRCFVAGVPARIVRTFHGATGGPTASAPGDGTGPGAVARRSPTASNDIERA